MLIFTAKKKEKFMVTKKERKFNRSCNFTESQILFLENSSAETGKTVNELVRESVDLYREKVERKRV